MLTVVTLGGIPGGFLAPQIIMRSILPRFFLVSFALSAVCGYLRLLLIPTTMPILWAILLGYGGFAFPAALALITGRTHDVAITARTSAFVQSSGYVLAAIGPWPSAVCWDSAPDGRCRCGSWSVSPRSWASPGSSPHPRARSTTSWSRQAPTESQQTLAVACRGGSES